MALKPCAHPGCKELVKNAVRCPQHEAAHLSRAAQEDVQRRGSSTDRGYDAQWRALRAQYVRLHPHCEACLSEGRVPPFVEVVERGGARTLIPERVVVDHIVPHRGNDSLRLDPANLQTLCLAHHSRKTRAEGEGYRAVGAGDTGRGVAPR